MHPIPADLERLIQRAGTFYSYSADDLAGILDLARRDPDGLRLALEADPLRPYMAGRTLDSMLGTGQHHHASNNATARPYASRGYVTR